MTEHTTQRPDGAYASTIEDCEVCDGRGIPDEFSCVPQINCKACHGQGTVKMKPAEIDPEAACMHDGCDQEATQFEEVAAHWHDYVWCAEHAKGKITIPLKGEISE